MASRAEKLAEARRQQAEAAKQEEERKAAEAEEKRKAALERKAVVRKAAAEARKDYEEFDGKIFCKFCGDLVEKPAYDDHVLTHPAEIRDRLFLGSAVSAMKKIYIFFILKKIKNPKNIFFSLIDTGTCDG